MSNTAEERENEGIEETGINTEGVVEPELDEEGNPIKPEVEAWMQGDGEAAGTEGEESLEKKPEKKLNTKQKLRADLGVANDELAQLRQENEDLKKGQTAQVAGSLKRPNRDDFDDDAKYDEAYDLYRDQKDDARDNVRQSSQNNAQAAQTQAKKVDAHYERGAELIEKHTISPDAFHAADEAIRTAVETERPGHGEFIVNDIISRLGEGSEKTLFYVGRNKTLLNEFRTLLKDDPTGLDALVFMTKQGEKANGTKTTTSRTPAPAATANGEVTVTTASKEKKKHEKETDPQARYNIKKAAKKAGHDVSDW